MNETSEQAIPRTPSPVLRPVRFFLHWVIKLVVLVFLGLRAALRPRLVRYGLVLLLVGVAIGWRVLGAAIPGTSAQPLPASAAPGVVSNVTQNSQLPPSPVIERYIRADAAFDAAGMYGLLSDSMKGFLQGRTDQENVQQIQTSLEAARAAGRRYTDVIYMGGLPLENGENVYFYVLKMETNTDRISVPYIYVIGPDNKIDSIQ